MLHSMFDPLKNKVVPKSAVQLVDSVVYVHQDAPKEYHKDFKKKQEH